MRSSLFARPNLRLLLLVAAGVLCLQHLITLERSNTPAFPLAVSVHARDLGPADLRALLEAADFHASVRACHRLSDYYEKRGNYRKALHYLRRAEMLARSADPDE